MQIDFYILENQPNMARFPFACKIIEKIYQSQQSSIIICNDLTEAEKLDELLWTFKEDTFIPHLLTSKKSIYDYHQPIEIDVVHSTFNCKNKIVLYLSNSESLSKLTEASRIIEIVSNEQEIKENARKHFRWYQQQAYPIKTHIISS